MALDECEAVKEADTVRAWLPLGLDDGAPEAVPVQLRVAPGLEELESDTLPVSDDVAEGVAETVGEADPDPVPPWLGVAVAARPPLTDCVGEADSVASWLGVPVVEGDDEELGEGEELREDVSLLLGP